MKRSRRLFGRYADAQAGVTLIEALVTLLIMSFGMLALVGLQGHMRRSADLAKQRSEAVRLVQQDLETIRSFSELALPADAQAHVRAFAQIADLKRVGAGDPESNASFTLNRVLAQRPGEPLSVQVTVSWEDRTGTVQQVIMGSFITPTDPRLSGSLAIAPEGDPTRRPQGRHLTIPPTAKDLGDGHSVFKPPATSSGVAWVFNNQTGRIVKLCQLPDHTVGTAQITRDDVAAYCSTVSNSYLLSGAVRFSTDATADSELALSPALPLSPAIITAGTSKPPAPPPHDCFSNAPLAGPVARPEGVVFYCAVYPNLDGVAWTGRLILNGIELGHAGYRICRYSADYNGDKTISNVEHPLDYVDVKGALTRQNFLVVAGSQSCPVGRTPNPADGLFYDSKTIVHQEKL
ncbi:type IV pilus modification PilV family protein [Roseateles cavernae]|uniref:type IV pilus modification PilV family protein n=1 Tax=Roseateles cavernae TaxID=3153578 RepID=UPI0032E3A37F